MPGCVPVAVPGCCTASAQTCTVRPGAGSRFGRSVARSGPHQRERRSWPSAVEGTGVADRWSLSRVARLRAASFGNREAFSPFVLVECVQGDLEAIRFVAESGQRPGRLDSGLGSGIAGVDAQSFASSPACSSHKGLPSSSRCWCYATLAMSISRHLSRARSWGPLPRASDRIVSVRLGGSRCRDPATGRPSTRRVTAPGCHGRAGRAERRFRIRSGGGVFRA